MQQQQQQQRRAFSAAAPSAPLRQEASSQGDEAPPAVQRDVMEYDVLVVGGGPSGLSAAIRLKQLQPDLSVCLIDKGKEIGAHILSGACIETRSLEELFPGGKWRELGAPLRTRATRDEMYFFTESLAIPLPTIPQMDNHAMGNYIISLGELCKWLGEQAEQLGVEIYTGFAGSEVLYDDDSGARVVGVATGDFGIGKDGRRKDTYQPGIELRARQTLFAEGCRGSLTKTLYANQAFNLRADADPQTFGLGVKEIWEIDPKHYRDGLVMHMVGWPLDAQTYGGAFLYMYDGNKMSVGYVVGLDYTNPTLSPYQELQRFKHHPKIRHLFSGEHARCIKYGARSLIEGGLQAIPKLTFPGGVIIGDSAGFLNAPKIKGVHTAMKSGILAAEAVSDALQKDAAEASSLQESFRSSWLHKELWEARNIRHYFSHYGLYGGLLLSGIDALILRGRAPYTLHTTRTDNSATRPLADVAPIQYPKPDGKISFDLLTNLARSGTNHDHDQPPHLRLIDPSVPKRVNLPVYGGPEGYYCPARVYEYVDDPAEQGGEGKKLQINAQNCLHCKACDIKDPQQNINWTVPQGGEGPAYNTM